MMQKAFRQPPIIRRLSVTAIIASFFAFACLQSYAEQVHRFADHDVHYIIIPTTFLESEIADQYNVARARNRALINVSILNKNNQAVTANISGRSRNLLGQTQNFDFRKVQEGEAIYYLAELLHSDEDMQRVTLEVTLASGRRGQIKFNQKMYLED